MIECEAVKILKEDSCYECSRGSIYGATNCGNPQCSVARATNLAINALEKQIAKKPTEVDERMPEDYAEYYYLAFMCPSCGGSVAGQPYRPNHCKHCGQKLDWSEV